MKGHGSSHGTVVPDVDDAISGVSSEIHTLEELLRRVADDPLQARQREELASHLVRLKALVTDLESRLPPTGSIPQTTTRNGAHVVDHPQRAEKRGLARIAWGATALGGLLALFILFESFVTPLIEARDQRSLMEGFRTLVSVGGAGADTTSSAATSGLGEDIDGGPATFLPSDLVPAIGDPVALLEIPALGVSKVVVEGTGPGALKMGPGHHRATPMPGQAGNAVIAGRRTTYGKPFERLDRLEVGDQILTTTPQGRFTYRVSSVKEVSPGDPDPLAPTEDDVLTLVTSTPAYIATGRLTVVADLQGQPASLPEPSVAAVGEEESGLSGDTRSTTLTLIWLQLLLGAIAGVWWIHKRWSATSTYVVTMPVMAALLFVLFENADRLLPGTL